jgi:S-adenosylmethionine hydrolase
VAAHLANGIPLQELGTPITDPVRIPMPKPVKTEYGWRGEVIHIDHFGNIASNIRIETLGDAMDKKEQLQVKIKDLEIKGLVNTFGERPAGAWVALVGSTGNLGISVVNGNAAAGLGVKVGDIIEAHISHE